MQMSAEDVPRFEYATMVGNLQVPTLLYTHFTHSHSCESIATNVSEDPHGIPPSSGCLTLSIVTFGASSPTVIGVWNSPLRLPRALVYLPVLYVVVAIRILYSRAR